MKNRTNRILLALCLLTAVLYAFLLLMWVEAIPHPFFDSDNFFLSFQLWAYLGVGFHVVPCFCLQLLVCRAAKRPWVRLIPVFLLLGLAAWFTVGFFDATGWDNLGWGLLLLLCIAPAAGYALAWTVYGLQRTHQHNNQ